MTGPNLPPEVLALLHGPVRTITHLELLLALRAARPTAHTLEHLVSAVHVTSRAGARDALEELAAAGLIARVEDDGWQAAPRDAGSRDAVDLLAAMYDTRPVTLMRALYERPDSRAVSDAV